MPAPGDLRDVWISLALFALTIATRLPHLSRPDAFVFDEVYYAPDAADIIRRGVETGGVVHPPLGKWLIGLGIEAHGFTAVGWRLGALVAGGLVVVLTYLAARQLVSNRWLCAMAGVLVVLDGIMYTSGRAAMLDIFVALFTMLAVWCTLAAWRRRDEPPAVARYCWGAAVAVGLGMSVKWSLLYVLLVVLIGFVALHTRGGEQPHRGRAVAKTLAILLIVPSALYVATYIPWMVNIDKTWAGEEACLHQHECSYSLLDRLELFKDDQKRVWDFQTTLLSDHNSNADFAYYWVSQTSASILFRKTCIDQLQAAPRAENDQACIGAANGDVMEIDSAANPVVWFGGLFAAVGVAWFAWRRRSLGALLLLAFFFYQWFPWLLDPFSVGDAIRHLDLGALLQQRRAYSFYLPPMVAVMAIWPAVALDHRRFRWLGIPLTVLALAAFLYLLPIWQGRPMSPTAIKDREYWENYSRYWNDITDHVPFVGS